jgi:hypothetical protein
MEDPTFSPFNWFSMTKYRQWMQNGEERMIDGLDKHTNTPVYSPPDVWWADLIHVQALAKDGWLTEDVLECYARILYQALEIPSDCNRELLCGENHNLRIFANPRAIQVYCSHNSIEKGVFNKLVKTNFLFGLYRHHEVANQNYDEFTRQVFWEACPYLAWEYIVPDGIDMEALSPRDANAHMRAKQAASKLKPPVPKVSQKEKDHPPPPPAEVREPPCPDRRNGAIYRTGKCLGKGGFAICYEGQLAGTKQLYALKIVKSYMPVKKLEQKVVSTPAIPERAC